MYEEGSSREIFLRRPNEIKQNVAWPMMRQKGSKIQFGTMISKDTIGAYLHYWRGRSVPHVYDGRCEACDKGYPFRYYGYAAALVGPNDVHGLIEFTDAAMAQVDAAYCKFRTLRGLVFKQSRVNLRSNGRMHVHFEEARRDRGELPKTPDVIKMLMNMWEVPELFQIEFANRMALDRLKGAPGVSSIG
jgi:hypothetical protein